MSKPLTISTVMFISILVFSGCTKTTGNSVSSINPSVNLQAPQSVSSEAQVSGVPALENGSEINNLEADLNQTNFNDIDIEIDSSL